MNALLSRYGWMRLTLIILLAAGLPQPGRAASDENFRVCADPVNPPFSDRQDRGFENKIAHLFAEKLGRSVAYTWFPQRIGFIRNTLKSWDEEQGRFLCDYVMGVPAHYDLTITTKPYYHSVYALIYAKGRGWDDIKSPGDLSAIDEQRKQRLRIAMFDRGPGTSWIVKHGLVKQGVPYQSMPGDANINPAIEIERDLKQGVIDMAILWGPMAGYIDMNNPQAFTMLPMPTEPGIKFDYAIAMGVRHPDKARRDELDRLIVELSDQIDSILREYHVPLVR